MRPVSCQLRRCDVVPKSVARRSIRVVRRDELKDALRGVDLLLGHLKNTGDSLPAALEARDVDAVAACADPMVTIATILIRKLREASNGTIQSALALVHDQIDPAIPRDDIANVESLIVAIVSARRPPEISSGVGIVALTAHKISVVAAKEIAKLKSVHVNSVVAGLRNELKVQGDAVQLTDPDAARAASEEYASDPAMRKSRQDTTITIARLWNDAANILHVIAETESDTLPVDARDSLRALSLLTVTCAALTKGIYDLAADANLYPAMSLLRQLVEAEFILWKFARNVNSGRDWLHSSAEQRRTLWRPASIYRDEDNDYRQKDYAQHCELCGHPTPMGARIAAGVPSHVPETSLLSDQINHSYDAWRHMMGTLNIIDAAHALNVSQNVFALNDAFTAAIREHIAIDSYRYSSAYFADPID